MKRKWFSATTPRQVLWLLLLSQIALATLAAFMLWISRSAESTVTDEKVHLAKVLTAINQLPAATNRIAAIEDETEQTKEWRNLGSILTHSWSNGAKRSASFVAAHGYYIEAWKIGCWSTLGAIFLNLPGYVWLLIHWRKSSGVRTAKIVAEDGCITATDDRHALSHGP